MKKPWIIVIGIVVLVGAAFTYAVLRNNGDMPYEQTVSNDTSATQNSATDQGQTDGQYVAYSEQAVADTQDRKWLFFHAPWCPQCRALENDITARGVPDGLTIFKVDYDTATDLKKRYGVTLQTTLVEIDDQGNEVDKFVAYNDPSLAAVLDALNR